MCITSPREGRGRPTEGEVAMETEHKSGIGRDLELYSLSNLNEKVLLEVYGAGLSEWNRGCRLERRCSPICGVEYVLEGSGRIEAGGKTFDLEPGDVFILHFHEHHIYGARDSAQWKKIWFVLRHSFVTDAMLHLGLLTESRIRLPPEERPRIEASFRQILALLQGQPEGFRIRASTIAYEALHLISQFADSRSRGVPLPPSLLRAVRFANEHIGEPLTVEELARSAFCSRIHLTRLFKHHFGVSSSEWIRSFRMGYAGHLLATTDIPVKTIAAKVGYADPLHFSAVFHRAMAETPSAFRKKHVFAGPQPGAPRPQKEPAGGARIIP
jgi:AraC-like DNA-binding protein/quercetin dioxygenase-like cupin family protein